MSDKSFWTVNLQNISIDLLDPDPENMRVHDEENLRGIGESLRKYGLQKPIVVEPKADGRYRVLAGNGTLLEAREAGAEFISCCVSDLRGLDAMAYGIADNETNATSTWDWRKLQTGLKTLNDAGYHMPATAFPAGELSNLLNARFDPPTERVPLDDFAKGGGESKGELDDSGEEAPSATTEPTTEHTHEQHFVHWRTDPQTTLVLVTRICGLESYDLDVASNEHSLVPARVALLGGDDTLPVRELGRGKPAPGGRVKATACGLRSAWPAKARCWWNPPYNDLPPWLLQVLWHAGQGGRGAGIIPGNLLETAWGQALLLARSDLTTAIGQLVAILDGRVQCHALERWAAGDRPTHPDASLKLLMHRGRVAFLDHRRPEASAVAENKGGSILVFWGFDKLDESVQPDFGVWL